MTKEVISVDIDSFNSVEDCETAHELELLNPDMLTSTGIVLLVLGAHSEQVVKHSKTNVKKYIGASEMAKKQKREAEFTDKLVDTRDQTEIDSSANRVVGWLNVTQEFSQALLKAALKRNPLWIGQINDFSEAVGNFTKRPALASPSTPDSWHG